MLVDGMPPLENAFHRDSAVINWPDYWSFPLINSAETEVK